MKSLPKIYTGKIYADDEVLSNAPRNKPQGALEFFNLGKYVTDDELEKEYASRGLMPADVYALAAWCEEHKDDERKYFATHWKDAQGKWCFSAFGRWIGDERFVNVFGYDLGWDDCWWFGAVRKSPFNKPQTALTKGEEEVVKARLLPQIVKTEGCWNWNGVVSKGYGLIKIHSRSIRVHRLMYEVFVGPIPEGLVIDHLCKNKQCVNPEHLEAVTWGQNTLRGDSPMAKNSRKTVCSKGHLFYGDNVVIKDGGRRRCKKCLSKTK